MVGDRSVDGGESDRSELDQEAAPIVGVEPARDVPRLFEPIEAAGDPGRREHQRPREVARADDERLAGSAKCGEDVEVGDAEAVPLEHRFDGRPDHGVHPAEPTDRGHRQLATDDVVLRVPGSHPLAGDHVGPDALLAFVERSRALTDDGERIDVLDVLTGHDHVALCCTVTATRPGRAPLHNPTVHLARLAGDRVAEVALHNRDDRPVNTFWS